MVIHGIFLGISDPGISLSCLTEIKNIPTWHRVLVKHGIHGLTMLLCNHGSKGFCACSWLSPPEGSAVGAGYSAGTCLWDQQNINKSHWRLHLRLSCSEAFCGHTSGSRFKRECIQPQPLHRSLRLASPDPLPWGSLWLWYLYFNTTDILCCFTVINCRLVITLIWGPL